MMRSFMIRNLSVFPVAMMLLFGFACAPSSMPIREEMPGARRSGWTVKFDGSASSPVVASGVLYVGSKGGGVYAFDPTSGGIKWHFQTGNAVEATPAVEGGTVFIGSNDSSLYAIDALSGKKKWSFQTGGAITLSSIVEDGIVYTISRDGLHAIDAITGQERWAFAILLRPSIRRPIIGNRIVYLTAERHLYAIDAESGLAKWTLTVDEENISAPAVAHGLVFFSAYTTRFEQKDRELVYIKSLTKLYAVNAASGKMKWEFRAEVEDPRGFGQPPIAVNDTVYFASAAGLFAIDLNTGNKRWSFSAKRISTDFQVDDRFVYIVTNKGSFVTPSDTLHALDASTGQEQWSFDIGGFFGKRQMSIKGIHGGVLYATGEQYLHAIDTATGKKLWSFKTETRMESHPLVFEGMTYTTSVTKEHYPPGQGYLYAIDAKTGKLRP